MENSARKRQHLNRQETLVQPVSFLSNVKQVLFVFDTSVPGIIGHAALVLCSEIHSQEASVRAPPTSLF